MIRLAERVIVAPLQPARLMFHRHTRFWDDPHMAAARTAKMHVALCARDDVHILIDGTLFARRSTKAIGSPLVDRQEFPSFSP